MAFNSFRVVLSVGRRAVAQYSTKSLPIRNDWTKDEIGAIYNQPLLELMYQAATVHRTYWNPLEVQQCTLLSIKTGGCSEDCGYCSQSSKHTSAFVKPTPLMSTAEVVAEAIKAKEAGSTRSFSTPPALPDVYKWIILC